MLIPNELVRIILKIKYNNFRRHVISKRIDKYAYWDIYKLPYIVFKSYIIKWTKYN